VISLCRLTKSLPWLAEIRLWICPYPAAKMPKPSRGVLFGCLCSKHKSVSLRLACDRGDLADRFPSKRLRALVIA